MSTELGRFQSLLLALQLHEANISDQSTEHTTPFQRSSCSVRGLDRALPSPVISPFGKQALAAIQTPEAD